MGGIGAVILAGGRSSRMGQNKALLEIGERTIIQAQILELGKTFAPLVVVSNQPELYSGMGAQAVQDHYPGYGPLAGIHAGLMAVPGDGAFVIPCDMPFITAELGLELQARMESADAVVLSYRGKLEPLCAVYHKRCVPVIEEFLRAKHLKIIDFYPLLNVRILPVEELSLLRPAAEQLFNINTPAELEMARRIVGPAGQA